MDRKRILTVTLNPAIDCFFRPEESFRKTVFLAAGGKGVNVSRVLNILRVENFVTGIKGGHTGRLFNTLAKQDRMKCHFSESGCETRINVSILGSSRYPMTRFIQKGPKLRQADINTFKVKYGSLLGRSAAVIISGSNANGAPADIYRKLISAAHRKKILTVLDSSGRAFAQGLAAKPFMIKPNLEEAEHVLRRRLRTIGQKMQAVAAFHRKGIAHVLLSLGKDGVIASNRQQCIHAGMRRWNIQNDVGCGDAMIAGFVYGYIKKRPFEESVRLAVAAASAYGRFSNPRLTNRKFILELVDRITTRKL